MTPPGRALAPEREEQDGFAASFLAGLRAPRKRIESKWLYDAKGSRLFEKITQLPEYYLTRTETDILHARAGALQSRLPGGAALVELGSGSSAKTRILLNALPSLAAYVPVDISGAHLHATVNRLSADYPRLKIQPVVADFMRPFSLPPSLEYTPKLLFFPGSTIGNFEALAAQALISRFAAWPRVMAFVIGVDVRKDEATLKRAYDDASGVTAAFNLNLLLRANRELGADFDLDGFRHEARWNATESRIEMHLVSQRDQSACVCAARIGFRDCETIHTENSYKYTIDGFRDLADAAGWRGIDVWTDEQRLFSVHVLVPQGSDH
jgi:L-histidine N-alpha-methyltransferase